ncbi:MAG TPA: hypothetical protein VHD31_01215 [Candidatus Paceibacterota bacterium]|nr:hypothetical protein [Candidatus Paceibacterota bacterium]
MHKRGFTVFFAVLVSSLALAIGLAVYDLLVRELALSQTATQSQYAIYASDMGAECALYWDAKYNTSDSAFATSSTFTVIPSSPAVTCNGQDITAQLRAPATSANAATTTFTLSTVSGNAAAPCATVTVAKAGNPSQTTVTSHGYNTCSSTGIVRLERALQINY